MQKMRNAGERLWRLGNIRSFRSIPVRAISDDFDRQVLVERSGCTRSAILNRPSVLNALSAHMGLRLERLYRKWEDDPNISFVMLKGSGRAFCAGGDIVSLYHFSKDGNMDACRELFWNLCNFIYVLGTYSKPHVAILDGITMGGGGGVSIPGHFRVATERTIFATPETMIGYHLDAAASFYLSRLPGSLGEYLGLTGEKLDGAEMVASGLATHYVHSEKIRMLEEELKKIDNNDPSILESYLIKHSDSIYPKKTSVLHRIKLIDKCFSHNTIEEILDSLEMEYSRTKDEWCNSIMCKLKEASPLSLKVSLRSIREARVQTIDQCLFREYRMSLQAASRLISSDLCEGIRARMIDKDYTPKWDPPTLAKVTDDMVEHYLCALDPFEPDLELPTKLRDTSYYDIEK